VICHVFEYKLIAQYLACLYEYNFCDDFRALLPKDSSVKCLLEGGFSLMCMF
jgi:hypothetical protein